MSRTRRRYPSDLSDAEWTVLKPLLASPERRGRPPKWATRRVADAVFYLLRSGCAWRMLSQEFPPWQTVYYHFYKWRRDGRLRRAHDRLREAVRLAEGRDRDPSAAVTTARRSGERGWAAPRGATMGRSGSSAGSVTCSWTPAGSCSVRASTPQACTTATALKCSLAMSWRRSCRRLELVWADCAYTRGFREWAEEERGWRVEVPYHRDRQLWRYGLKEKPRGFLVLPRRWVVERTFAWLGQARRLAKDYERLPETGVAMIHWAMSRIMLRRLAGAVR